MTQTQQPEALRLADKYEIEGFLQDHRFAKDHWCRQAAAELRSQHARIAELEEQLSAIGAGGVEPLRKQAVPVQMPEPDAWRYTDARGHFRYRGRRVGFAAEYQMLKPEPLYTEQQVCALLAAQAKQGEQSNG